MFKDGNIYLKFNFDSGTVCICAVLYQAHLPLLAGNHFSKDQVRKLNVQPTDAF